jgi:hypothetical protein
MEYFSRRFLDLHTFARNNYNNQPYTVGDVLPKNMCNFSIVQQHLVGQDFLKYRDFTIAHGKTHLDE